MAAAWKDSGIISALRWWNLIAVCNAGGAGIHLAAAGLVAVTVLALALFVICGAGRTGAFVPLRLATLCQIDIGFAVCNLCA